MSNLAIFYNLQSIWLSSLIGLDVTKDRCSIPMFKKTFYCNDSKITEFEMHDTKIPSTAYVVMY